MQWRANDACIMGAPSPQSFSLMLLMSIRHCCFEFSQFDWVGWAQFRANGACTLGAPLLQSLALISVNWSMPFGLPLRTHGWGYSLLLRFNSFNAQVRRLRDLSGWDLCGCGCKLLTITLGSYCQLLPGRGGVFKHTLPWPGSSPLTARNFVTTDSERKGLLLIFSYSKSSVNTTSCIIP